MILPAKLNTDWKLVYDMYKLHGNVYGMIRAKMMLNAQKRCGTPVPTVPLKDRSILVQSPRFLSLSPRSPEDAQSDIEGE